MRSKWTSLLTFDTLVRVCLEDELLLDNLHGEKPAVLLVLHQVDLAIAASANHSDEVEVILLGSGRFPTVAWPL